MSENRSPNTVSTVSGVNDNGHRAGQNHPPSAYRMPRAVGVFRKAGFPVEPYPADWRTPGVEDVLHPFATMSDGLRQTDTAVHEWVGLAVYWLTGRSSELFPVATRGPLKASCGYRWGKPDDNMPPRISPGT
jgi:hypothetical protein